GCSGDGDVRWRRSGPIVGSSFVALCVVVCAVLVQSRIQGPANKEMPYGVLTTARLVNATGAPVPFPPAAITLYFPRDLSRRAVFVSHVAKMAAAAVPNDEITGAVEYRSPVIRRLHLLRNMVGKKRRSTNEAPGLLVPVVLKNASDAVKQWAVMEALEEYGAGVHIVDPVEDFHKKSTFEISSGAKQRRTPFREKTQLLVIGGLEHNRKQIHLTLANQPIHHSPDRWKQIVEVPLHKEGGVHEWFKQLKPAWKLQLHLIKKMANHFGAAGPRTIRLLTQAILTTKFCHGAT
ncbi:hypothetical protein HPB47_004071, partial [Ixodes persulcatus]